MHKLKLKYTHMQYMLTLLLSFTVVPSEYKGSTPLFSYASTSFIGVLVWLMAIPHQRHESLAELTNRWIVDGNKIGSLIYDIRNALQ